MYMYMHVTYMYTVALQVPVSEQSLISTSTLLHCRVRPPLPPQGASPAAYQVLTQSLSRWAGTWGNPREIPYFICMEDGSSQLLYGQVCVCECVLCIHKLCVCTLDCQDSAFVQFIA